MIATRRIHLFAGSLVAAAIACGVVALVRRDNIEDGLSFKGAYFDEPSSSGGAFSFSDSLFEPFHWMNAYLWLGLGAGFLLSAILLAVVSRLARVESS